MNQYTYTTYRESPPKILFECEAEDIGLADEKCKAATGIKNVDKDGWIGVTIKVL